LRFIAYIILTKIMEDKALSQYSILKMND
jgi:hypothetical protein